MIQHIRPSQPRQDPVGNALMRRQMRRPHPTGKKQPKG